MIWDSRETQCTSTLSSDQVFQFTHTFRVDHRCKELFFSGVHKFRDNFKPRFAFQQWNRG
jgi:hypothetical protein